MDNRTQKLDRSSAEVLQLRQTVAEQTARRLHFAWLALFCCALSGCLSHDQVLLPDPAHCRITCEHDYIAPLDPTCNGYHATCWRPWCGLCPTCPPPPGGPGAQAPLPQSVVSPNQGMENRLLPPETIPPPAAEPLPNEPQPLPAVQLPTPGDSGATPLPSTTNSVAAPLGTSTDQKVHNLPTDGISPDGSTPGVVPSDSIKPLPPVVNPEPALPAPAPGQSSSWQQREPATLPALRTSPNLAEKGWRYLLYGKYGADASTSKLNQAPSDQAAPSAGAVIPATWNNTGNVAGQSEAASAISP